MKQTKILGLTMILLFSALILRGQGWRRFYTDTTQSSYGYDFIQSNSGGYMLNLGYYVYADTAWQGRTSSIIKTDFEGRVVRTLSIKTEMNGGKLIELSDSSIISVDNFAKITKFNNRGDSIWQRVLKRTLRFNDAVPAASYLYNGNYSIYPGVAYKSNHVLVFQNSNDSSAYLSNVRATDGQVIFTKKIAYKENAMDVFLDKTSSGYICLTSDTTRFFINYIDSLGNLVRRYQIQRRIGELYPYETKIKQVEDNNLLFIDPYLLFKVKPNGDSIWRKETYSSSLFYIYPNSPRYLENVDAVLTKSDSSYVILQNTSDRLRNYSDMLKISKFNFRGDSIWSKFITRSNWQFYNVGNKIIQSADGGFVISFRGASFVQNVATRLLQLIKVDSLGNIFTNYIRGKVINDTNTNCLIDSTDKQIKYNFIQLRKGNDIYYANSDINGNYEINVDTGIYTIKALPRSSLWENCTSTVTIPIPNFYTSDTVNFVMKSLSSCPLMQVDISNFNLRRCFNNNIQVKYCNHGTATAQNARIEVKLDSLLEYVSATRPLSNRNGQTLIFNLGNVAALDCGNFSITARVRCGDSTRIGQTLCTEAHIYPDTICNPPANWSGANVGVSGRCDRDSVRFLIKNTTGIPTSALRSIVVEDEIVFLNGTNNIPANATQTITLPANGRTWRLNQQQEPNNPRNALVTAVVEGCRVGTNGFSTGFVNDFPNNSGDPSVSTSCLPIVGSFDPNEKLAFPEGFKTQHFIEQNTPIDYQIGFQNTGNDTAFTVILRDTLDKSLDIATLNMGASSHAFTWDLVGKNVLIISFDNIKLVDSFRNEVASHGFVKFRINQKKDVALGTIINNQAAIYFDFNRPIFTNTTFHTVGKNVLRVSVESVVDKKTTIKVSPNPFSEHTTFELDPSVKTGIFELFDVNGRILRRETFDNNRFEFQKRDLPTGIFIFKISTVDGRLIGHGKVVAQ